MAYNTTTYQYYVMDDVDLGALKLNLGWKGFDVENKASKLAAQSTLATGSLKARDWFQPHAGLTYKLGGGTELFAGFTQVTRAFTADATSSPFSTNQAAFDAIKANLKPEQSDTYEGGLRVNRGRSTRCSAAISSTSAIAAHHSHFAGHRWRGQRGAERGQRALYGLEAVANYKLPYGFALFASYSYNNSTYRDDVVTTSGVKATAGKTVVDTPKHWRAAKSRMTAARSLGALRSTTCPSAISPISTTSRCRAAPWSMLRWAIASMLASAPRWKSRSTARTCSTRTMSPRSAPTASASRAMPRPCSPVRCARSS
jgi:outer membrane receptor protein involved in Fe transport